MNQKTTVIFDFDGTLVDVETLFLKIFNELAPSYHYPPLTESEIPLLKELGAKEFLKTRVRVPFWKLPFLIARGRKEYRKAIEHVKLFPGMREGFMSLKEKGYRVGILSSNAQETIQELLLTFDMEADFVDPSSLFGKAKSLRKTLEREHIDPESVIYVGDEVRDVLACQEIGLDVIAVTWGLNSKTALTKTGAPTADTPQELFALLEK